MSVVIRANSYCPACRGIVLSDCSHSMSQIRSAVRPQESAESLEAIKGLRGALEKLSKHTAIWNNPCTGKDAEIHFQVERALSETKKWDGL